jgi:hypothetical protein
MKGVRNYTFKKNNNSNNNNNNPLNPNKLIEEGMKKGLEEGRVQGLKEGKAQGLKEGKAEEMKNTLDIIIMSAWNNLRLLMMSRQQLNILFINVDPHEAFKYYLPRSSNPYTKFTFNNSNQNEAYNEHIRKIYQIYQNIENNLLKARIELRKLYWSNPLMSERLIEDISHAMENSFIIPLVVMYDINAEYIEPYLWLLFSKYPSDKQKQFSSLDDMLTEIEEDNKKVAPIIQAIVDNNIKKLNEEVDTYIRSFTRPIKIGPVQAGLDPLLSSQFAPAPPQPQPNQKRPRSTLRSRRNAATKKYSSGSRLNGHQIEVNLNNSLMNV